MIKYRMEFIPVLTSDNEIETVYFWEDLFDINTNIPLVQFNIPVVIMAVDWEPALNHSPMSFLSHLYPLERKQLLKRFLSGLGDMDATVSCIQ